MRAKKTSGTPVKVRKRRWTKDDTELTLLSVPTLIWYLIFSYLPMFGIIMHLSSISWHQADMDLYIICSTATGRDLETLSISLVPIPSQCCFATQYFTTLYLLLSVLQWQ